MRNKEIARGILDNFDGHNVTLEPDENSDLLINVMYKGKKLLELTQWESMDKKTLEIIQKNPRRYLIEENHIKFKENQKVLFCNSKQTEHTIETSMFEIVQLTKNRVGVPMVANIRNLKNKSITYNHVDVIYLEPLN
jgi:hypothetical protein